MKAVFILRNQSFDNRTEQIRKICRRIDAEMQIVEKRSEEVIFHSVFRSGFTHSGFQLSECSAVQGRTPERQILFPFGEGRQKIGRREDENFFRTQNFRRFQCLFQCKLAGGRAQEKHCGARSALEQRVILFFHLRYFRRRGVKPADIHLKPQFSKNEKGRNENKNPYDRTNYRMADGKTERFHDLRDFPASSQKRRKQQQHQEKTEKQTCPGKETELAAGADSRKEKETECQRRGDGSGGDRRGETRQFPAGGTGAPDCGVGVDAVIHCEADHDSTHTDDEEKAFPEDQCHCTKNDQ